MEPPEFVEVARGDHVPALRLAPHVDRVGARVEDRDRVSRRVAAHRGVDQQHVHVGRVVGLEPVRLARAARHEREYGRRHALARARLDLDPLGCGHRVDARLARRDRDRAQGLRRPARIVVTLDHAHVGRRLLDDAADPVTERDHAVHADGGGGRHRPRS